MKVKVKKRSSAAKTENNSRIYEFRSIEHFNSFYDLFDVYFSEIGLNSVNELDADTLEYLRFFDAFEGMQYYVMNCSTVTVCDAGNGEILSENETINDFLLQTIQYAHEQEEAKKGHIILH